MGKSQKTTHRRIGMQVATLCISTTMVLSLLGLVVLTVLSARNISNYVRENLVVTIVLGDSTSEADATAMCTRLRGYDYTRQATYISREQALREQTEAMGSDPSEFLGTNPFVATIELQLIADYANSDSIAKIARDLRAEKTVAEVAYQEDLTDKVNRNLQRLSALLLALAVLLLIISYALISNSVRLGVYARRFSIYTMKLVGASWNYIRKPFMKHALKVGLIASVLASLVIAAIVYFIYQYQQGADEIIGKGEIAITIAAIFIAGFTIMLICTLLSVNKFLKMSAGELYKI